MNLCVLEALLCGLLWQLCALLWSSNMYAHLFESDNKINSTAMTWGSDLMIKLGMRLMLALGKDNSQ